MKTFIFTLIFILLLCNISNAQIFEEVTEINIPGILQGSIACGDLNNDGLMDFAMTGSTGYGYFSAVYKNTGNNFELTNIIIDSVRFSSLDFGDYLNNNFLDLIESGCYHIDYFRYDKTKVYKNNYEENLIEQTNIILTQSSYGNVEWLDFDNDSYSDIVQIGLSSYSIVGKVYKNNKNNTFSEQPSIIIEGVVYSTFAWGDYNNDSFVDLIVSGSDGTKQITKLYKNDGNGNFIYQSNLEFVNVANGSAQWGDYNNDGYLDLILCGGNADQGFSLWTKIYKNNGNETFTEMTEANLFGVDFSSIKWGDFNNDGLLDLLVTGSDFYNDLYSFIYKNIDGINFTIIEDNELRPVQYSTANWWDFNEDGKLDIILSGNDSSASQTTRIYRNTNPIANKRPNVITNLQTEIVGNDVIFSWDEGTDDNQPSPGLNYNIYIYNEDNRDHIISGDTVYDNMYVASPQAFPYYHPLNGKRLVPKRGHIQGIRQDGRVSYIVKGVFENCKTYYWSVQAIDASFEGGPFAEEQAFVFDNIPPEISCSDSIVITLEEGQTVYSVSGNEFDPVLYSDNCQIISIINNYNNSESLQGEQIPFGNYTITWTVTDIAGNQTQCNFNLEIKEFVDIIDISQGNITVFPNPTTGIISVDLSSLRGTKQSIGVYIFDIHGISTFNFICHSECNEESIITLDLSSLPSGIYFMQFIINNNGDVTTSNVPLSEVEMEVEMEVEGQTIKLIIQ